MAIAKRRQTSLAVICATAVFLLFAATTWPALAKPVFYAGQITTDNRHLLPPGGLDAIGGVGDWLLTDGELCAVVSSQEHATYLSLHGGVLVDLWHCTRANDQWSTSHAQLNLQKNEIPPIHSINAGQTAQAAWIESVAMLEGIETRTRYALSANTPGQLAVRTQLTRLAEGAPLMVYGNSFLHPRGSLTPFTLDLQTPDNSRGFDQPYINTAERTSILSAVSTANLQILLGSRHIQPSISYGIQVAGASLHGSDGTATPLNAFMMGGLDFTMFGAFTYPLPDWWPRTPGIMSFLVSRFFDLDIDESFHFDLNILVGEHADAASITDRLYSGSNITGQLDTHSAGITVKDEAGRSLTYVRPDSNGKFNFRAPADASNLQLSIRTPWGTTTKQLTVTSGEEDLGTLATGTPGTVMLPRGKPMALIFTNGSNSASDNNGSSTPVFYDELTAITVGGERTYSGAESHRLSLSGSSSDPFFVQLPPGDYRVLATRGMEYGVTEADINVVAGSTTILNIDTPQREVDTTGLMTVDLHVHSGVGFDASLLPRHRIADFIAQGGELLITTEHNIIYDLQPTIAAMGLSGKIAALPGIEITGMVQTPSVPRTIAHGNIFPLTPDSNAFMGGALPFEGKRLGQVINDYKAKFPTSLYQLNHPRGDAYDDDIAFFNHLSQGAAFEPTLPLTDAPNASLLEKLPGSKYRDIDFDAVELLSGEAMGLYQEVRTDWFALLRQNIYKVATGNSDSHASSQLVAYPRNYFPSDANRAGDITPAAFAAAIKSGNVYASTGPVIRVALGETPPGGTFEGAQGMLHIEVASASWVTITEASIWVNGELRETIPISAGDKINLPLTVTTDSFVFVEVAGTPSEIYRKIAPGFQPFAFANPIFLDIAGNGWHYNEP